MNWKLMGSSSLSVLPNASMSFAHLDLQGWWALILLSVVIFIVRLLTELKGIGNNNYKHHSHDSTECNLPKPQPPDFPDDVVEAGFPTLTK
jgi:hypothetical protein